jgi:hypothetical protein
MDALPFSNQRDRRRHVVVLGNVARLSPPRLDVARRLRERFQVVAIVEDFLPEAAKAALATALWAWPPFRIGRLSEAATRSRLRSPPQYSDGEGAGAKWRGRGRGWPPETTRP